MIRRISSSIKSYLEKNDAAYRRRRTLRFRSADIGPIIVENTKEDGVSATDVNGTKLTINANSFTTKGRTVADRRVDRIQLQNGVEIRVDGELIGHLTQTERTRGRSGRAIAVTSVDSTRFPPNIRFRLRRFALVTLEDDDGFLITYWPFTLNPAPLSGIPRIRPRATSELVLLYVAVEHGFREPLESSTAWLPVEN